MAQTVFSRYEKKYLMPEHVYRALRAALESRMQVDQYGLHTICNIYYDHAGRPADPSLPGASGYKEKLRLRSYGIRTGLPRFLEIKKKYDNIVNKRRYR
jgi:hypothetical protein